VTPRSDGGSPVTAASNNGGASDDNRYYTDALLHCEPTLEGLRAPTVPKSFHGIFGPAGGPGAEPFSPIFPEGAIGAEFQKAKQWELVREWAQRGLDLYGEEAARPEAVEDLHKRVAHATAKIAAARSLRRRSREP
jgi:hypothetical protein